MPNIEVNSRNLSLDLCRAAAIVLVAVQHAWSMLDLDNDSWGLVCYMYRAIVNCGVPMFVMVSGALLLGNPCGVKQFYIKRLARVVWPFLFWAIPVYIIGVVTHRYEAIHSWSDVFLCFFPYLLQNEIQDFHWFVHMILVLYALTPLLQRALSLSSKRLVEGLLAGWAIILILQQAYPAIYVLRYVSALFPYLGVYIAGYYIKCYMPDSKHVRTIAAIAFVALYVADVLLKTRYYFVELFTTICLFTLLSKIPISRPIAVRTGILSLSRYSYTIYLIHIPLISALYQLLDKLTCGAYTQWATPTMAVLPICVAAIVLAVCYVACLIADKCRYINNNLVGISK